MITVARLCFALVFLIHTDILEAFYLCGIRKGFTIPLAHKAWKTGNGQWPWHVAVFHKQPNNSFTYACGGTLVDPKHVLTAAHCAANPETSYSLPPATLKLHFGQQFLSNEVDHVQIRDVSAVWIHPAYSTNQNDIAVLVVRFPVVYTDFIIPICLDQQIGRQENLIGHRGWITGWGTTEQGRISDELRTLSLPVVDALTCLNDDQSLPSNLLYAGVFCAGDRNGTSPGSGDSGGGMYFSEDDRWLLRGIISFGNADALNHEIDTSKYVVFANVQFFLTWIREIMAKSDPQVAKGPTRISEKECERFKKLPIKHPNGICSNYRDPHTVYVVVGNIACSGVLINENHVITACQCTEKFPEPATVESESYGQVDILNITCHPQYNAKGYLHDLAVVKLNTSINLSSSLVPACLANNASENLFDTLVQTGFVVKKQTSIKSFIKSRENRVITLEECKHMDVEEIQKYGLSSNQLCAINRDKTRTNTAGASGGPLQSPSRESCLVTAVGISSYGTPDDEEARKSNKTFVDVYSRVANYLDWIEKVVWNVEPLATNAQKVENGSATDFSVPAN